MIPAVSSVAPSPTAPKSLTLSSATPATACHPFASDRLCFHQKVPPLPASSLEYKEPGGAVTLPSGAPAPLNHLSNYAGFPFVGAAGESLRSADTDPVTPARATPRVARPPVAIAWRRVTRVSKEGRIRLLAGISLISSIRHKVGCLVGVGVGIVNRRVVAPQGRPY